MRKCLGDGVVRCGLSAGRQLLRMSSELPVRTVKSGEQISERPQVQNPEEKKTQEQIQFRRTRSDGFRIGFCAFQIEK